MKTASPWRKARGVLSLSALTSIGSFAFLVLPAKAVCPPTYVEGPDAINAFPGQNSGCQADTNDVGINITGIVNGGTVADPGDIFSFTLLNDSGSQGFTVGSSNIVEAAGETLTFTLFNSAQVQVATADIVSPYPKSTAFPASLNLTAGTYYFGLTSVGIAAGVNRDYQFQASFQPLKTTVPGPIPLLGAGAAFAFSRKLRHRIKEAV